MLSWTLLALLAATPACALEARWTPAADGGPARFSKKHRDSQGIDDSRWTKSDEESVSYTGLVVALGLVAVGAYVLFEDRRQRPAEVGGRLGGAAASAGAGSTATAEEARKARLDRFATPGATAAPPSWNEQR